MTTTDKATILIVGTLDTKLEEILFLRSAILAHESCQTKILDVSRSSNPSETLSLLPKDEVVSPLTGLEHDIANLARGDYIDKAIEVCIPIVQELGSKGEIHGIVSAGGSSNSSLATALMRKACPIGFPKLMVSTMASGDIKPYIEETDITMMYSVVDIAGINSVLKQILMNAAGAITGMTMAYLKLKPKEGEEIVKGKKIGVTMFGVTTPCVNHIRNILTLTPHDVSGYEIYVFHATGSGGRAMERLIEEDQLDAVIDLTTTEIADELFGGVLTAGPSRLEAAARKGIPTIISIGACDMVNFGPKDSVPGKFKDRNLYYHNPSVTLMRTTKEENAKIGSFIADKLKTQSTANDKIRVILPKQGVSMLDKQDQPFYGPEEDERLFNAINEGLKETKIEIIESPDHINDEVFAALVCENLLELMGVSPRAYRLANARRRKWSFDHGKSIAALRRTSQVEVRDN